MIDANKWLQEMETHGTPQKFYNTLTNLEEVYLASDDANDKEERVKTMWLLKKFKELF